MQWFNESDIAEAPGASAASWALRKSAVGGAEPGDGGGRRLMVQAAGVTRSWGDRGRSRGGGGCEMKTTEKTDEGSSRRPPRFPKPSS